jgi:hypothetical protein
MTENLIYLGDNTQSQGTKRPRTKSELNGQLSLGRLGIKKKVDGQ